MVLWILWGACFLGGFVDSLGNFFGVAVRILQGTSFLVVFEGKPKGECGFLREPVVLVFFEGIPKREPKPFGGGGVPLRFGVGTNLFDLALG